ncbi:hypothetical protein, partial [Janthinobacterium sp.]|uniref:hypothetical protein n=1 Tax=Janthinobacterium sp. TaxID=1871054 RepID=UPI002588BCE3
VQEGMLQLRQKWQALGYTPERGFAGAEGMVPAAEAGSLAKWDWVALLAALQLLLVLAWWGLLPLRLWQL